MPVLLLRRGWLVLVLVGLAPRLASAQPPAPADTTLTLSALLEDVRKHNPALEATRLHAEALARRPEQVAALPPPTATATYQPRPILTARGPQRSRWHVQQKIPFPGTRALKGKMAALEAEAARFQTGAYRLDLALDARRAFYELYRLQEQLRLIRTFQQQLERFENIAATRYAVGQGTQQAILKAQLEKHRLTERHLQLKADRRTAALALARLTGRPTAEAFLTATPRLERPQVTLRPEEAVRLALARRPEVEALQAQINQAGAQIALAEKQFWPDFTVGLTYFDLAESAVLPTADGRDALALSVGLQIPLWRGKLQANVEEARLSHRNAEMHYQDLRLEIRTRIRDLLHQVDIAERRLRLFKEMLLPQAEVTLEAALSAYKTGQTGFLDLLDAERTLFQLRMSYEAALNRYLDATARLARALGVRSLDKID